MNAMKGKTIHNPRMTRKHIHFKRQGSNMGLVWFVTYTWKFAKWNGVICTNARVDVVRCGANRVTNSGYRREIARI